MEPTISKRGGQCDVCREFFAPGATVLTHTLLVHTRVTVGPCCNGHDNGVYLEVNGSDTVRVFTAYRKKYVGHITRYGQDCYGYRLDHSRKQFHTAIEGGVSLINAARWVAGLTD